MAVDDITPDGAPPSFFLRVRVKGGRVVAGNYGRITSLALDPIEKKPIAFFRPGSCILAANVPRSFRRRRRQSLPNLRSGSGASAATSDSPTPTTSRTIEMLHRAGCHVEVTTLVIPGRNDSDESIDAIAESIASVSPEIPLHVTRVLPGNC